MKLNEKIQFHRKQKGWTQEKLANELEVSRQALSKWELGTAIPDTKNVLKLSRLFGVSTDYLLDDECDTLEEQGTSNSSQNMIANAKLTDKTKQLINEKGYAGLYILAGREILSLIGVAFICYAMIRPLARLEPMWWKFPIQAFIIPIVAAVMGIFVIVRIIIYLILAYKLKRLAKGR